MGKFWSGSVKQTVLLNLIILWVVTAMTFSASLKGDFIANWDDAVHISHNKMIQSLSAENIRQIFKSEYVKTYIPLTLLTFAVEYQIAKVNPFIYHFDNLLLHLAVVSLIFLLAKRLGLTFRAAFLAALLFAVHPMHVEPVAWATARKDVLYSVFYLLALYHYLTYTTQNRKLPYFVSIFFCLLSILSKAMAVSLPWILFLFDWKIGRKFSPRTVLEKVPYFLCVLPFAGITFNLNHIPTGSGQEPSLLLWVWTLVFYVRQFLFPITLLPLYKAPTPISLSTWQYLGAVSIFSLIGLGLFNFWKKPWLLFAFLFFFLSVFFLLRTDPLLTGPNTVADRFMYLPSFGLCLLAGFYVDRWIGVWAGISPAKSIGLQLLFLLLICVLCIKSYNQSRIWNNEFDFWSYLAQKEPENDYAHFYLAQIYNAQGNSTLAWDHYLKTIEFNPKHVRAHNVIGKILYANGDPVGAMEHFQTAISLEPNFEEALQNYGMVMADFGRFDIAESSLTTACQLAMDKRDCWIDLGDIYLAEGNKAAAREKYQEVLSIDGQNALAYNRLGVLALQAGAAEEAIGYFQKALEIDPQYNEARFNLGLAIKQTEGKMTENRK